MAIKEFSRRGGAHTFEELEAEALGRSPQQPVPEAQPKPADADSADDNKLPAAKSGK